MQTDYQEKYRALRQEVYGLINEKDFREFGFNKLYSLKSHVEAAAWLRQVTENIISKFENDPSILEDYFSQKFANCPLCNRGSSTPYQSGFKLSEGLRRHLLGTHHSSNQCFFMVMAREDARDRINDDKKK